MQIPINRKGSIPLYRQIVSHVHRLVNEGVLSPNFQLPSTRELAEQIGVHRNTVLRAYEELAADGTVKTSVGSGTFISGDYELKQPNCPSGALPANLLNWDVIIRQECKPDQTGNYLSHTPLRHTSEQIEFDRYMPDANFFPYESIRKITAAIMRRSESNLLKYGSPAGYDKLRDYVKGLALQQGINMSRNRVVIVNGSTQGMDLISRLILQSGDGVALGIPSYTGVIRLFTIHGARIISIPTQSSGIDTDVLEQALNINPVKMLYIIPNFHNPTGITLPLKKRLKIVELVKQLKVVVLEDDYNYQLRFSGSPEPPLKALDETNQVIYSGSFSKILFPGFRIGWLIVPEEIFSRVLLIKTSLDISTSNLLQAVVYEFCRQGLLDKHLRKIRRINKERFQVAIDAMNKFFPDNIDWIEPEGGMMIWVNLPDNYDPLAIQSLATEQGVMISASPFFVPRGEKINGFRLTYAAQPPDTIQKGIQILGDVLLKAAAKTRQYKFHESESEARAVI